MRSRRCSISLLLSLSLLIGIGGCREDVEPAAEEAAAPSDPTDGLELQFGVQEATYAPDDSIHAVIRVVNRAGEARTLEFTSAQRFEIALLDSMEVVVHSWGADKSFAQAMGEEILEPGEELHYEAVVAAPANPGSYTLRGSITTPEADLESTLVIVVE